MRELRVGQVVALADTKEKVTILEIEELENEKVVIKHGFMERPSDQGIRYGYNSYVELEGLEEEVVIALDADTGRIYIYDWPGDEEELDEEHDISHMSWMVTDIELIEEAIASYKKRKGE